MVDQSILATSLLTGRSVQLLFFYTDPGAGALVWQLILASIIGGAFYTRLAIRRVKARFAGWKKAESVIPHSLRESQRSAAIK